MINKEEFLEGLRNQFEESDALNLSFDTVFKELDTWDSLTRFSIVSFVEDDYQVILKVEGLQNMATPSDLYEYINSNT
ncbi:MAG: acyl carrier protein [Pedobacter sp.]|nr:MAG: acyl carrier protein [Pedobacter sp.]